LLMLALPGSVYLYQGEELGLPEVVDLPEDALQDPTWLRSGGTDRGRDGCRVPLPWKRDGASFGFCPENARPWLPVPESWGELSREAQRGTEGSTLELYTRALRLRRELDALGDGSMAWLSAPTGVLFFEREPGIRCAVNLTGESVELPTSGEVLISSGPGTADGKSLSLPSDTAVWLRV